MSVAEIDAYIQAQPEPQRSTLEALRVQILNVVPDAEQCISYAMPGFRVNGKVVAGFASYKKHIGYYPHSGQVFRVMMDDLAGYEVSEKGGGVKFPIDRTVPDALIEKLIAVRMSQAFPDA
ncbi:uncharacterized protein YdhG (YjbR/CyaY superfamily) [Aurantimicrobium minutum]|uniref:iron chaperone n=1 Tax=Aurantimicrobium minutum TaxID=708131 RepID=UPI002473F201|nr:DUF1801 domain-containing protein [Aurantimicrobium minutum]MDH6277332.1 uncharacterized protein YdhG (YjbR/CyaY superfamily) [Aurantimicrobium minutum]